MKVNSYTDYTGNKVVVGDEIEHIDYNGENLGSVGVVLRIAKAGYMVHVTTENSRPHQYWGKFTKKVIK